MTLLWPGVLVALALVPALLAGYLWSLRRRRPIAARYSSLSLVRDAIPRSSRLRRHLPFALLLLAVASLVVAVARPVAIVAVPTDQTTVVLAIDVSRSMCRTDIEPSRLEVAQAAASSFIEREGSRRTIGVVAFAGFGEIVQGPTDDEEVLLDAVLSLTTGRRTAIGSAILTSIDAIAEVDPSVAPAVTPTSPGLPPEPVAPGAYVPSIIVLLTDGRSNQGPLPLDAARQAADRGIRVYTIGFGTANPGNEFPRCPSQLIGGEPFSGGGFGGGFGGGGGNLRRGIDEETLRAVAEMTGGEYYPAESAGELQAVFASLPTNLILKHDTVDVSVAFAAAGLALVGLAVLLARLWSPLPLARPSHPA